MTRATVGLPWAVVFWFATTRGVAGKPSHWTADHVAVMLEAQDDVGPEVPDLAAHP